MTIQISRSKIFGVISLFARTLRKWKFKIDRRLRRKKFRLATLSNAGSRVVQRKLFRDSEPVTYRGPRFVGSYDFELKHAAAITVTSPKIEVVEFSDVAVMGGSNLVFTKELAIHPDIVDPMQCVFSAEIERVGKCRPEDGILYLRPEGTRGKILEAVSLLGECTGNYAHWMTETLPKLTILDEYPEYKDLPLLVDGWIHPIFFQSIALLDVSRRKIIKVNRWQMIDVQRVIYVTPPGYLAPENREFFLTGIRPQPSGQASSFSPTDLSNLRDKASSAANEILLGKHDARELRTIVRVDYDGKAWAWLQENDAETAQLEEPEVIKNRKKIASPKRLYLRRVPESSGNPRHLIGGKRIEAILARFDFVAVDPATLSFAEQVVLMQQVECIVAPVGAALANLLFAPASCNVIALAPYFEKADYFYFSNMLGAAGHHLYYVLGPQLNQPNIHPLHRDYSISTDALVEALELLCSSKAKPPAP